MVGQLALENAQCIHLHQVSYPVNFILLGFSDGIGLLSPPFPGGYMVGDWFS